MTKLVKYTIIAISSLSLFYGCGSSQQETKESIKDLIGEDLDSLSFDEMKQTMVETYAQYALFHAFFSKEAPSPKNYAADEETSEPIFELEKPYDLQHFEQGISFTQSLSFPNSKLDINSDVKERDGEQITYYLDRIYYNDGSSDSIDRSLSRSFTSDMRKIDSVRITARYRYATALERIDLSKSNNSIAYQGGTIKLKDIDKNYAQYVMSDTISGYITTQALTKHGNIVGTNATTSGGLPPEKQAKQFEAIHKGLEKIAKKVKEDKYPTKEDLLFDIYNAASKLKLKESKEYYRSEYFYGNIETLHLFFGKERVKKDYALTFPVTSYIQEYNLVNDEKTQLFGIAKADGTFAVKPIYKDLEQVNAYYFTIENYYDDLVLHFNEEYNRLDTLKQYRSGNIERLTQETVAVSYRGKQGVLGRNSKLVLPIIYDKIITDGNQNVIIAFKDRMYTLFDNNGNTLFSASGSLGEFIEGVAVCQDIQGNNTWMINTQGEKILSINQYESISPFQDGLALASKNDKYGFIRKDGSIAIPFMYDDAKDFSYGITLVVIDGEYGLINTNNEFILPLHPANGYSISTNFGKRSYSINKRSYNERGQLVENDDDF